MTQNQTPLPDTGNRVEFAGGAQRDIYPGKPRYDLIPAVAIKRLAQHYANGALKYADRNWERGLPLSSFTNSMFSHIIAMMSGDVKEDHLAAIMWNAAGYIWTVDAALNGKLPMSLLDVPWLSVNEDAELQKTLDLVSQPPELFVANHEGKFEPGQPVPPHLTHQFWAEAFACADPPLGEGQPTPFEIEQAEKLASDRVPGHTGPIALEEPPVVPPLDTKPWVQG